MEELYLVCEDSLEGIFSGIYYAYQSRRNLNLIHLQIGENEDLRLFATYETVESSDIYAAKVARTINREFGEECYLSICRAVASGQSDKAEAVFRTVKAGLEMEDKKQKQNLMGNLTNGYIHRVFELARFSANEAHFLIEFIRFKELDNGILYATTGPKNNVITFVMPHFADRLPLENFVIYDEIRGIYGVHPAKKEWFVVTDLDRKVDLGKTNNYSEKEDKFSELFEVFFHTIAIKERTNYNLQRNMLPIRYREYMTEFQAK